MSVLRCREDKTEQTTAEAVDGAKNQTTKTKSSAAEIDRVYEAYPLKKAPARARIAIAKAFERLAAQGESDPAAFLIERIAAFMAMRERDTVAGRFVPNCPYPATWFNGECYDEPGLQPVKNCRLPDGVLGTEAELKAQTGWEVMRSVV